MTRAYATSLAAIKEKRLDQVTRCQQGGVRTANNPASHPTPAFGLNSLRKTDTDDLTGKGDLNDADDLVEEDYTA